MTAVRVSSLGKSYDGRTPALEDVDLAVASGEICFLLGPSGCGKTTLLRIVAGLLAPDRGRVFFDDEDVTGLPAEARGVGMVFQNYALWPHLDVAANVAFGLEMRRLPRARVRERVASMLQLVGLAGMEGRAIGQLSGGQQQRVALARALVVEPRLLLLDEPLSNLDARLREEMRSEIRRICKATGVTALYVTHDQQEALSTADRIAVLDAGRLRQVGTPRQCYRRPVDAVVAGFLGQANRLAGSVAEDGRIATGLGVVRATTLPPGLAVGDAVQLCLRPEDCRLLPDGTGSDGNAFAVTVGEEQYLGDRSSWQVQLADGSVWTVVEAAPPPRRPGERLLCRVDPERVIVVPAP